MKKIIVGEYDRYGYRIWDANSGIDYHSAGNSRFDSAQTLSLAESGTLSLRELRVACIKTCLDIVDETGGVYGGVERAEE